MVVTSEFVDSHRRGRIPESEKPRFRGHDTSLARIDGAWSTHLLTTTALTLHYLFCTSTTAFGTSRYSWVNEGKLAQILDNLLGDGEAFPMIVVLPEAHAPESTPVVSPDFVNNVIPI
jgi:hypothetical protein